MFDSEEDAKKAAADVLGTGAGTGARPRALLALLNMSKIQVGN